VVLAGCARLWGTTSADERRLEVIKEYQLLRTAPPGTPAPGPPETWLATGNYAGTMYRYTGAAVQLRSALPRGEVARFYVGVLVDQGWQDVRVRCTGAGDRGTATAVLAARWEGDFRVSADVVIEPPDNGVSIVRIGAITPHHTESGERPAGEPPDDDCLDGFREPT
jgi:hypothetical protein